MKKRVLDSLAEVFYARFIAIFGQYYAVQLPSLMPNRMHSTRAARAHKRRQPIVNTCDAVIIYTDTQR